MKGGIENLSIIVKLCSLFAVVLLNGLPLTSAFDDCNSGQVLNITDATSTSRCEVTLDEGSDIILNLNIFLTNPSISTFYTPAITTSAKLSEQENYNRTENTVIDIVAYPNNANPIFWSHKVDGNNSFVSKIVYIPEINSPKYGNHQTVKLILSNRIPEKIQFSLEIKLKDINIDVMKDDQNQTAVISNGSPAIWRFQNNKPNHRRLIRVHTTSLMEGCSIVTIQPLSESLHDQENNVAYEGRWQTMLKNSVIDVDIGADENSYYTKYKNGFFLVILLKTDPRDCEFRDYQSRKYGRHGSIKENKTPIGYMSKTNKTIFVHVSELQDPSVYISLIVITAYGVLVVMSVLVGVIFKSYVPVVGTVLQTKASCRFGKLDEIYLVFKKIQAIIGIDTVDFNTKNKVGIVDGEEVDHILIDIIYSRKDGQENGKTIELREENEEKDSSLKHLVTSDEIDASNAPTHLEKGTIDMEENKTTSSGSASRVDQIKKALNICEEDDVRIVSTIRQRKLIEKRRTCDPKLVNMATICDTTLFPDARRSRSKLYIWTLSIIGIFYIIPSIQLMLAAQNITYETGTEDVCYYNYLCRYHAYGISGVWFEDYGHVFSNISYIFCGVHFIILVYIRQRLRRKAMVTLYLEKQKAKGTTASKDNVNNGPSTGGSFFRKISKTILDSASDVGHLELPDKFRNRNVEFLNRCGIPEQYGIFYSLGGALICEGILSACYHICPVNESFQFDTTFMYIIAILMFLKVYQFRHPDLTARAYTIYLMIAVTLIFEAIGYYWTKHNKPGVFLVVFILTYLAFTIVFMNAMLFQGDREWKKKLEAIKFNKEGVQVYFVVTLITNISLAIFILVQSFATSSIVSNYLLIIFMLNMILYIFYYVVMKNYHVYSYHRKWESLSFICYFYLFLSALCGGIGLYFFGIKEKNTLVSPAESRHLNQECTISFFDKHDIWHFASAFGLLFSFLSLLTMEDNNTATPWENIPVF